MTPELKQEIKETLDEINECIDGDGYEAYLWSLVYEKLEPMINDVIEIAEGQEAELVELEQLLENKLEILEEMDFEFVCEYVDENRSDNYEYFYI